MKKYFKHLGRNLLASLKHAGLAVVHVVHGFLPGPTNWLRKKLNRWFNKNWKIQ